MSTYKLNFSLTTDEQRCNLITSICSQTTFNSKKFDFLADEIKHNFYEADVVIDKTICNTTQIRQDECEKMAKEVNAMIVIGGIGFVVIDDIFKGKRWKRFI